MVSGYSQAYSSYPSGWDSFGGIRGGVSCQSFKGCESGAHSCNALYEQWCNHAKAEMSALYHTFIATCQMLGLSVLKYCMKLFSAIAAGRTDYENMLPMTLGVYKAA